ncbi:MAG: hypothetical protein ROR55_28800 [Devosia sp.]
MPAYRSLRDRLLGMRIVQTLAGNDRELSPDDTAFLNRMVAAWTQGREVTDAEFGRADALAHPMQRVGSRAAS